MNKTKALLIGVLAFGCNNVQAGLANAGFEAINGGKPDNWVFSAPAVSGGGFGNPSTPQAFLISNFATFLNPAEGSKFLQLITNSAPALTTNNTSAANYLTQNNWIKESQANVSFSAGDIFKFNFAFKPNPQSTDAARASVFHVLNGVTTNVFSIILQAGAATQYQLDQFGTPSTTNIAYSPFTSAWQLITVPIYTTGTYTVEYAIANLGGTSGFSSAFFDSYQKVPEASTLSLLALGLLGLAQLKTRKTA